ncbi:DUF5320 domain-containing protein [Candidatus Borrarchaeum sp.]|uniref:DUF5320 domain-containing protein n=1 Tax=Candidatus Borrarchaeum sp. TaxID=2846742 RepID=UPI00257D38DC|nr:DUF5320 domain-containing protein [Candidatus Borrarchaeum sp.]
MSYGQGGRGGRGRYRWMYQMTGLPGWMRFGFSPGWLGRSPTGLPPAAQWITQSGLLPQFTSYLQSGQPTTVPTPGMMPQVPFQPGTVPVVQEKQVLTQQLDFLRNQIEGIRKRLEEIEREG